MKNVFKFDGAEIIPRLIKREIGKINSVNILSLCFAAEVRCVFYSHKKISKKRAVYFYIYIFVQETGT